VRRSRRCPETGSALILVFLLNGVVNNLSGKTVARTSGKTVARTGLRMMGDVVAFVNLLHEDVEPFGPRPIRLRVRPAASSTPTEGAA